MVAVGLRSPAGPFISSLLAGQDARATYYRESRSIMVAEPPTPGHRDHRRLGEVQFEVYGKLKNEDTCERRGKLDETRLPSVTSGVNPGCIQAETVFGAVRRQGNPDGLLTAGVFGKPKLGRRRGSALGSGVDAATGAPAGGVDDDNEYCAARRGDDGLRRRRGACDGHGLNDMVVSVGPRQRRATSGS